MLKRWIRPTLLWFLAVAYAAALSLSPIAAHGGNLPTHACVTVIDLDNASPEHGPDRCQHHCAACIVLPPSGVTIPPVAEAVVTSMAGYQLRGLTLPPELLPPII